ncbi:branched-chain amino acid transport system II carrier protein [Metabacillus herbersteinensis]|uniref:Branched-chain amino acid transport system carrier protein n=1 Tax=Metabacillus herbersteinensis TaxID=283816 RepID=A0ABV6GA10_9BACI
MDKKLSGKDTLVIGLMLFALFFGAGNMIFPPSLGQAAGENVWLVVLGFLITGVGLPLLGVISIGLSGSDVQSLSNRVHPLFGWLFPIILYLAIGPLFGIPRTGTVAYEMGVTPFLPDRFVDSTVSLFVYTLVFFGITFWLSLNPSKLVDTIGKVLTPALILVLVMLSVKAFVTPMGSLQKPQEDYVEGAFFKGFLEGYLTMDTIAALVFGIVVINAVKSRGVTSQKEIAIVCTKAGLIASVGLIFVYVSLAYLGATSVSTLGYLDNGSAILASSATVLFGPFGNIVLGLAITFACLTTSVGLVSACGEYFSKILPRFSYNLIILFITLFSTIVANFGLSQIISFSVPILVTIYPLAIVLIMLTFLHSTFKGAREVYVFSITATASLSIIDGLNAANIQLGNLNEFLNLYVPFFEFGVGWVVPAVVGGFVGWIVSRVKSKPELV